MLIPFLVSGQHVQILARNLNTSDGLKLISATVNSVGPEGIYATIDDGPEILLSHTGYEWVKPLVLADTGDTFRAAGVTVADRSDSIHLGGAAQWVFADRPGRRYMFLQNNSAGDLWYDFKNEAVIGKPSFRITPGSSANLSSDFVMGNRVSVIGATTGQEFTAKEDDVSQTSGGNNFTANMMAYWHLNETSGTRYDGWTTKNHLTDNATVASTAGKVGTAADFVGANSEYLSLPYDSSKTLFSLGTQDLAVSLWIKPTAGSGVKPLIGQGDNSFGSATLGFLLELNLGTGVVTFTVGDGGFSSSSVTTTATVTMGAWNHVYARYDHDTTSIRCFINNVGSSTVASVVPGTSAFNELAIGTYPTSHTAFYTGAVDEVIIWHRALTASELTAVFNAGTAGQTVSFTP